MSLKNNLRKTAALVTQEEINDRLLNRMKKLPKVDHDEHKLFEKSASLNMFEALRKTAEATFNPSSLDAREPIKPGKSTAETATQAAARTKGEQAMTKEMSKPTADLTKPQTPEASSGFSGALLNTPPDTLSNPMVNAGVNANLPGGQKVTTQNLQIK